jgi:anti-sigma regulatory factor (Ser/Thr protein kinase)
MHATASSIRVPAETQCLEQIRSYCRCALETLTDRRLRSRLVLAIDEAAANVIEHAYSGRPGPGRTIEVAVERVPDRIVIRIIDRGIPFDPRQADPDCPFADKDLYPGTRRSTTHFPRHGFGLRLIRTIMDEIDYRRTADGENELILTKNIGSRSGCRNSKKGVNQ